MKEVIDTVSVALANGQPEEAGNVVMQEVNHALLSMGVDEAMADKIDNFIILLFIIGIALLANLICRKIILRTVAKLVRQTKATWDDIVFNDKVMVNISRMVAPILIYISIPIAFPEHADSALLDFLRRLCMIYILAVFLRFVSALFTAVYLVYSAREQYKDKPLKGLLQTAQVILFFIGAIIIISILIKQSPVVLLTGLGASAAVLMLVFKDSIMGFVSGIQLSANNMLKVGDWITMPKYGADGTVIEVTLNTVKVRNFDNTIVTISPATLVNGSFQNWIGMQKSGGRRVKRIVYFDFRSIRLVDETLKQTLLAKHFATEDSFKLKESLQKAIEKDIEAGKDIEDLKNPAALAPTNLQLYRRFMEKYLRQRPEVNTELTLMVRHMEATQCGLPIEFYFFIKDKVWVNYEHILADIMEHAYALANEFGLKIYEQYPEQ